ncbi:MAG: TerB family tellurite resistance protein [Parahaliea sp.]
MIDTLKALFQDSPAESDDTLKQRLHLAAAALLVETMKADFSTSELERQTLQKLLEQSLSLKKEQVHLLIEQAQTRTEEATSLYEFTRLINQHFSPEYKRLLIQAMWRVAYADGNLDKYEEALIRQVAELIYVAHTDYIQAKLIAAGDMNNQAL